jgi:hypothetical protein
MPCDLTLGRLEPCKDNVGGLDAIYFVNFGQAPMDNITIDADDIITEVTAVTNLYKFELKGTNTFDQVVNSSRDAGTTFVEQTLSVMLKNQDSTTHKQVKMLAYGRPQVVVKTRTNKFFFAGMEYGMELTTANVASGTAMADAQGYTLTFVGTEKNLANFLDCTDETTLATTVFDGATIVTD